MSGYESDATVYAVDLPLLDTAAAIAREEGLGFIAPEQLLMAVVAHPDQAAERFLHRHNITADWVSSLTNKHYGIPKPLGHSGPVTIAHRSVLALAGALRAGRESPIPQVAYQSRHLLMALLQDDVASGSVIGMLLLQRGLTPRAARASLEQV